MKLIMVSHSARFFFFAGGISALPSVRYLWARKIQYWIKKGVMTTITKNISISDVSYPRAGWEKAHINPKIEIPSNPSPNSVKIAPSKIMLITKNQKRPLTYIFQKSSIPILLPSIPKTRRLKTIIQRSRVPHPVGQVSMREIMEVTSRSICKF